VEWRKNASAWNPSKFGLGRGEPAVRQPKRG
jgi:hypothetical protein